LNIEQQVVKESIQLSRIIQVKLFEIYSLEKSVNDGPYNDSSEADNYYSLQKHDLDCERKKVGAYISQSFYQEILKTGLTKKHIKGILTIEVEKLQSIYLFIKNWDDSSDKDKIVEFCFRTIEKIDSILSKI
jgi:hypothetical protein